MPRARARLLLVAIALSACRGKGSGARESTPVEPSAGAGAPSARAISSIVVDHGELDTVAPSDAPRVAATVIAATIYKLPNTESRKLGYLRLGGSVPRDPNPVAGQGCPREWYRIYPMGFVCTDAVTPDPNLPLVRAAARRPDLSKPLPYRYGFVRATSPQYLRIPTKAEQEKSEFELEKHLETFNQNLAEWQAVTRGSNDVLLDDRGLPIPGGKLPPGLKASPELTQNELFGGSADEAKIPFWLENGRSIPNVSGYEVPEYAVFADRVRRKTGLSFVDSFATTSDGLQRRFAVTVDLRLVPASKVKPDSGSPYHGIELSEATPMPFAIVTKKDTTAYKLVRGRDEAKPTEALPHRVVVPLSGKARIEAGRRFYQALRDTTSWLDANDIGVVAPPAKLPDVAAKGEKWLSISIRQQTLVLWEGQRPWYATLVSTGRDRLGDPAKTLSTPLGEFRLKSKHIAAAMDSEENSTVLGGSRARAEAALSAEDSATIARLKKAEADGTPLSEDDARRLLNVKKGRHPEYGVTRRRGSQNFELRDVPWIQYFASGYALHGAYWHDVFGIPRSHGCVNLTPVDARIVFMWTDPPLPEGWHGMNIGSDMGEGTTVLIHE